MTQHLIKSICLATCASLWSFLPAALSGAENTTDSVDVLLVVGAAGTDDFGESFESWTKSWEASCRRAGLTLQRIGPDTNQETDDKDQLKASLDKLSESNSPRPLWLVLIGHGTWDGVSADFNLAGPDLNARELHQWTRNMKRPLILVNCTSSSGPFVNRMSGKNRVVVTATKSGSEQNYARFGKYFAEAFASLDSDLDHDDSVSVKEAFLKAVSDTQRFYKEEGRLATEHALLDDNGDKRGSSYALVRGSVKTKGGESVDGGFANLFTIPATSDALRFSEKQLAQRAQLESRLRKIRQEHAGASKSELRKIALPTLLELAALYRYVESRQESDRKQVPEKASDKVLQ